MKKIKLIVIVIAMAMLIKVEPVKQIPKIEKDTAKVTILMYHHITSTPKTTNEIETEEFKKQLQEIKNLGYKTITFKDIEDYVEKGEEIPEKSVIITFDDGYLSNYEIAYPILKEKDMKATIFVVGSTMGNKEYYKNTNYPIIPHFNEEEALEMISSGVISIQSHTYDMHQNIAYEKGSNIRQDILKLGNETEEQYENYLKNDLEKSKKQIEALGEKLTVLAYPHGKRR